MLAGGHQSREGSTRHGDAHAALEPRLTRLDHATNVDVRGLLQVAPIQAKMREARLRWFGHVMRRDDHSVVRTAPYMRVGGGLGGLDPPPPESEIP